MIRRSTALPAPVALAGAFTAWALHFLILYSFQALACARGFADERIGGIGIVPAVGGVATVAAIAACFWLVLVRGQAGQDDGNGAAGFLAHVKASSAVLALLAIIWTALPLVLLPPCR
jgi:hypothetical protein